MTAYAAEQMLADNGVSLSRRQIQRQADTNPGVAPERSGRQFVMPPSYSAALVNLCVEMRRLKLTILKPMIKGESPASGLHQACRR